jgi:hypothetical protein
VLLDRFFAVVDVGSKVALVHVFLFGELPAFGNGDEFLPLRFSAAARYSGGTLFGSGITFCASAALTGSASAKGEVATGHRRDVNFMLISSSVVRSV